MTQSTKAEAFLIRDVWETGLVIDFNVSPPPHLPFNHEFNKENPNESKRLFKHGKLPLNGRDNQTSLQVILMGFFKKFCVNL